MVQGSTHLSCDADFLGRFATALIASRDGSFDATCRDDVLVLGGRSLFAMGAGSGETQAAGWAGLGPAGEHQRTNGPGLATADQLLASTAGMGPMTKTIEPDRRRGCMSIQCEGI